VTLFYQPAITEGARFLDAEESKHCAKVLRKKAGDTISLTDGRGTFFEGRITACDSQRCEFEVISQTEEPVRNFKVHIAVSPTKSPERTAWFVEKAVEIGIDKISFLLCHRTERIRLKMERINKVAISAMKQSNRATLPEICGMIPFAEFVSRADEWDRFIASVDPSNPDHLMQRAMKGRTCCVLIGPEGDFSPEEISQAVANKFCVVSLGTHRLRTESAALVATHILDLVNL
jgi:16S rRNA (uracil1498-N3)-methyltransferase